MPPSNRTPIERLFHEIRKLFRFSLDDTTPCYINDDVLREDIDGYAIECINSDAKFQVLDIRNEHSKSNGAVNMTLPAGEIVYVGVDDIQLSQGDVIVYTKHNK